MSPGQPADVTPASASEAGLFARTGASAGIVSRGVLWKLASQVTIQLFGLAVSLGVARLLAPSEYGDASLALALAAFAVVFSDLTLGAVLVQRRTIDQDEASSLMWFSLGLGLTLTGSFALLTPQLASLVGHPGVQHLLLGVAPVFAISTAGTVPTALLNRRMDFRRLELRMIAATVVSSTCGLLVALLDGGAWALVAQQLTQATLLALLAWIGARWLPSLVVSPRHLGTLAPSALYVAGSRAVSTVGANLDNLLVGRYLGTAALGAYGIAYNIFLIPLTRLAVPIQEISFPMFSSLETRAAVGRLWLRANVALFAVLAPVMIVLAVEADDFVEVVLGSRWAKAGPVLRLLLIGGLFQVPRRLVPSVLQACGRERLLFGLSLPATGIVVVAMIIGLRWGTEGVAAAIALAYAVTLPFLLASVLRTTGVTAGELSRSMAPVLTASLLMAIAMACFHVVVSQKPLVMLFTAPAVGAAAYAGVLLWQARDLLGDLRVLVSGSRQRVAP